MTAKPIVGLDIDHVLADFDAAWIKIARKLYGRPVRGWQHKHWEYEKDGFTRDEVKRVWNYIRHTDDFWTTLEPLAKTSYLSKCEDRFNLFFITARISTDGFPVNYQSEYWLRQHFGLKAPFVTVANKKGPVAKALDLEWYLDDKVENCLDVVTHATGCKAALLTQPWNADFKDKRISRTEDVNTWLKSILERQKS